MKTVWGSNPEFNRALGDWCAAHIFGRGKGFEEPFYTMAVFDGPKLVSAVVFNNYHSDSGVIEMHGASIDKRWLMRPVLFEMFDYAFNHLGCQTVVMRVSERNVMWNGRGLHRFMSRYGFKGYRIPRLRGRDEDEIIYTLADDDFRANGFHKENASGQIRTRAD